MAQMPQQLQHLNLLHRSLRDLWEFTHYLCLRGMYKRHAGSLSTHPEMLDDLNSTETYKQETILCMYSSDMPASSDFRTTNGNYFTNLWWTQCLHFINIVYSQKEFFFYLTTSWNNAQIMDSYKSALSCVSQWRGPSTQCNIVDQCTHDGHLYVCKETFYVKYFAT